MLREVRIEEVAADKGYQANATLELADHLDLRTYIPEPQQKDQRVWTNKPAGFRRAVINNRRRMTASTPFDVRAGRTIPLR